jgi:hypothetical protein
MRRSRTSLITFAILTVGAVGAGAAMAAVTPQVTASGTPQVVAMREAGNWAFLGSSNGWADVQSSPGTPQPQLTLNLGKSQAPALVRLDWSGRVVCFDACNLRFVVDGQPTHETTDAPPSCTQETVSGATPRSMTSPCWRRGATSSVCSTPPRVGSRCATGRSQPTLRGSSSHRLSTLRPAQRERG